MVAQRKYIEHTRHVSAFEMRQVSDLRDGMLFHDDVAVAKQIRAAIDAAIERRLLYSHEALTGPSLTKIKNVLAELNSELDHFEMMYMVWFGKTGDPVAAAEQFIDEQMKSIAAFSAV